MSEDKNTLKVAKGELTKRKKKSSSLYLIGGVGWQAGATKKEGKKQSRANGRLQDGSTKKVAGGDAITRKGTHQENGKSVISRTKPLSKKKNAMLRAEVYSHLVGCYNEVQKALITYL